MDKLVVTPSWLSVKSICYKYSFGRTFVYQLLKDSKIESRLISSRRRVISVASVEAFINGSSK